jgi:hypothetical protein
METIVERKYEEGSTFSVTFSWEQWSIKYKQGFKGGVQN